MRYLIAFVFLLPSSDASSQTNSKKKLADSLIHRNHQIVIEFLKLEPNDRIADIGSGSGSTLIPIANRCPNCRFTVEDIDSVTCNSGNFEQKIEKSGNKTNINNFAFKYGSLKSTELPALSFNKVLAFDLIHELTYRTEILSDLLRILEKDGKIYIYEILVHYHIKKDKVCNYPYLTESEFKKLLVDSKIHIDRETSTYDTGDNRYIKIFECSAEQ